MRFWAFIKLSLVQYSDKRSEQVNSNCCSLVNVGGGLIVYFRALLEKKKYRVVTNC